MVLRPVNEPAPALLAKGMNETPRDSHGEYIVAGIEALGGHDPQGYDGRDKQPWRRIAAKLLLTVELFFRVTLI